MTYAQHYSRRVPQTQPLPGSTQVANSAGGYSFPVDDWTRLDRFLVLGSEGGSYYATEQKLTRENAEAVVRCLAADGPRAVARIAEVSGKGEAPSNREAIFCLALALKLAPDAATRSLAGDAVPVVCRTGSHLLELASLIRAFGGWGRGTRRAFAKWYEAKEPADLAYQALKYKSRNEFSHRDILRLVHPKSETLSPIFKAITTDDWAPVANVSPFVETSVAAKLVSLEGLPALIRAGNLTREVIPTEHAQRPSVWEALLERMPMTAMIRNLGNMSKAGLLVSGSDAATTIAERLNDEARLRKARVHPFSVLLSLKTYKSGAGFRGKGTWNPVSSVVDALDAAFYKSFGNVEPSGARVLIGIDISGSMAWPSSMIKNTNVTAREASAALGMITVASEKSVGCFGFATAFQQLDMSPRRRLDDIIGAVERLQAGGTDCALPMLVAAQEGWAVDHFVVYTDSETWAGHIHPVEALRQYRRRTGINAKLTVVGMVSNGFTIADPSDAGMLDVVGFSASCPQVIAQFGRPS